MKNKLPKEYLEIEAAIKMVADYKLIISKLKLENKILKEGIEELSRMAEEIAEQSTFTYSTNKL